MHKTFTASLALALATPFGVHADTSADIRAMRQEIEALRSSYEARLQALEQRLRAAEAAAAPRDAPVAAAAPAAAPPVAAPGATPGATMQAAAPPPALPPGTPAAEPAAAQAATGAGASAFNPALSLILSGLYTHTSQDPEAYAITGFQLPADAEVGPGGRGFSLAESELGISASIDPWFSGSAHIALHPDDSVSVEEAYVQTTAMGSGLTLKAGRFFSSIGYLNPQHAHAWDFVDTPLAYQAMLGTQYGDDGVQLRWLAPTDLFLEFGLELGRGRSFRGGDNGGNGAGMAALAVHAGGDLGASHSWRAGVSVLEAKAAEQIVDGIDASGAPVASAFSGDTRVWVADAVWKWAPNGNATRTNFKLQGEFVQSRHDGTLTFDPDGAGSAGDYRAVQSGWYLQGIYQWMPGWRVGLRAERLDPGTPEYGANDGLYALSSYQPRKTSLMFDWSPSEYSRVRLQLAQDRAREGVTDNQLFLQYQMSLGAHGAHGY